MGILAHDPGISQRELSERLAITPASTTAQVQKWKFKA
ncbi:MAG: winged helix-turn-helix domain-containing protein [Clostridia bacterium]